MNPYQNSYDETIRLYRLNDDFVLLEHCYNLLKNSNIHEMFNIFRNPINSFLDKLIKFIENTSKETVKYVGCK